MAYCHSVLAPHPAATAAFSISTIAGVDLSCPTENGRKNSCLVEMRQLVQGACPSAAATSWAAAVFQASHAAQELESIMCAPNTHLLWREGG